MPWTTRARFLVGQSLDKLAKGRTTLTIAHRLTTIKNADRILVLGKDGIEEEGSHEELLAKQGVYYRLWNGLVSGGNLVKRHSWGRSCSRSGADEGFTPAAPYAGNPHPAFEPPSPIGEGFFCSNILFIFKQNVIKFDTTITPRNPIMPYFGTTNQMAVMRNIESSSE